MDGQMKARMIYIEENITSKIQYRALRDVIEDLEKLSKNYPDATIEFVVEEEYGSQYAKAMFCYKRLQTEEEIEQELAFKTDQKTRREAARLAQYLDLKKEFEK